MYITVIKYPVSIIHITSLLEANHICLLWLDPIFLLVVKSFDILRRLYSAYSHFTDYYIIYFQIIQANKPKFYNLFSKSQFWESNISFAIFSFIPFILVNSSMLAFFIFSIFPNFFSNSCLFFCPIPFISSNSDFSISFSLNFL